jgi:hypothetical protein
MIRRWEETRWDGQIDWRTFGHVLLGSSCSKRRTAESTKTWGWFLLLYEWWSTSIFNPEKVAFYWTSFITYTYLCESASSTMNISRSKCRSSFTYDYLQ